MQENILEYDKMYWEEFSDQVSEDFEYIGVDGDIQEITNVDIQAKEFHRMYGAECTIKVYRKTMGLND